MRSARTLIAFAALAYAALAISAAALPKGDGAHLYQKKCGKCHRPYAPAEIGAAAWEKQFPEMKKRARLTDEETAAIQRYIESNMRPSHQAPG